MDGKQTQLDDSLFVRLRRALGPVAAGMILDFVDLATFGPLGLYGGLVVGGVTGWWLGGLEGLTGRGRVVLSALSGVYMMIPLTEPLPIATGVGAVARFLRAPRPPEDEGGPEAGAAGPHESGPVRGPP